MNADAEHVVGVRPYEPHRDARSLSGERWQAWCSCGWVGKSAPGRKGKGKAQYEALAHHRQARVPSKRG